MTSGSQDAAPLRVAVVGYGLGGSAFHAPFASTVAGLELAAIVTRNVERRRQAAERYPGVRFVDEIAEVWGQEPRIDLVAISTPNRTHVPLALAAIEAGRHVVADKPLAPSSSEARRVVDAAARHRVVLGVFQNRRWDGDFKTLRRLLAEGAIGEPSRFESRFERWRPAATGGWRERASPEEAGGLLFDLGSHLVDQALVLFGPAREVYAELDIRRRGVEADDDAFVALTHASGVRSHLYMSAVAGQPGPRFRVLGSRSAYTKWGLDVQEAALRAGERPDRAGWGVEPEAQWGTLGTDESSRRVPTDPGDYGGFYAGMVRAIRDGAPPPVNPADAIATLEVIEAARRSATERRVILLEPRETAETRLPTEAVGGRLP